MTDNSGYIITSLQNPKVREVILLSRKAGERAEKGLFVVEGVREVRACLEFGFRMESVFHCPAILSHERFSEAIPCRKGGVKVFEVTEEVYARMAYRAGTEGVIAVAGARERTLAEVAAKMFPDNTECDASDSTDGSAPDRQPLVMVAEKVEKPGNIGAILRTADACGASAVLLCDCPTDIYNPNLIRASLGGVFTQNIAVCTSAEAIDFLKKNNIVIYTAQLQDSVPYYETDMKRPCAIVMGSEADGLTRMWREASDQRIMIPMLGALDSLNVSVSAAVLCYEALRQRRQNG